MLLQHALGYYSYAKMALDTGEEAVQGNVLLLGGAETNRLTQRWMRRAEGEGAGGGRSGLALLDGDGVTLTDGRRIGGPETGVLMLVPHYGSPESRGPPPRVHANGQCLGDARGLAICSGAEKNLGQVIAASDAAGLADIMALAVPTVPPMTRVPFFSA